MENSEAEGKLISTVSITAHYLMNALNDAAFLCDSKGNVIMCSDAAVDFFSFRDKTRILGSDFQSYFGYDSIDEAASVFRLATLNPDFRQTLVLQVRVGLKELKHSEVLITSLAGSSGGVKHILVTFRKAQETDTNSISILRNEGRLNKLTEILLSNEEDSVSKAQMMLAFLGNSFGAITCSFCTIENNTLIPSHQWESPFNQGISPFLGAKQISELLESSNENVILIRKPALNDIFEAIPYNDEASIVKSIIGLRVNAFENNHGIIIMYFSSLFTLSVSEKSFLEKISRINTSIFSGSNVESLPLTRGFLNKEILDSFHDSIYVLDSEGVFLDANKGAELLYGYSKDEVIGQTPEFFSAKDKNDIEKTLEYIKLAAKGENQKFEWWGMKKNGEEFPKEIVLSQAIVKGKPLVVAVCRDISVRYKVEQELLKSNKELRETNISKDKFFSILAHDLKNPFQGLLGFIDLLYEDLDELTSEQVKEYLFNVRTASYHTYNLLENLLDWSRIQSGKMPFMPSVFDISGEIDSIINVLQANANRKDIRLINEVGYNTFVKADRNMIHSVIQNLITNSIKFSNNNGKIIIRSRTPQYSQKHDDSVESPELRWLEVSVADNGIGIPEEILPKLFQLNGQFSQAGTANEPGTGLGLVLCREMVEKNGGKIWAESIPDQGSTFLFTVPLSR